MPDPFDPNATMAQPLAKMPPSQLPVAAGASPQVQPAPTLARSIGGVIAPQGSAGAGIAQAKPLATAQPTQLALGPEGQEAARLRGSKPGAEQVKNPFLRTLATVGDALASTVTPHLASFIPGTTAHHNMLLGNAEGGAKDEQTAMDNASKRGLEGAQASNLEGEAPLHEAQTEEAKARAESLRNPKEAKSAGTVHEDSEGNMWVVHPDGSATAVTLQGGAQLKGKTPDEKTGTVHEDKDGNMWIVKGDGSATPVTPKGQTTQLQGKQPSEKTENAEQQFVDEYRKNNPRATVADAQRAFKKNEQLPPQTDRGQNFVDPKTHRLIRVEPGGAVPEGAVTAGGLSSEAVSSDKEAKATEKAKTDAARDYKLAQTLVANPSPTNDLALVMQYVGATKPDSLGKLRLNNNEVNLVYGTRSSLGDLEALVSKIQTGQSLTPKQRQDMLGTMKILAESRGETGGGGTQRPTATDANGKKVEWDGKAWVPR